MQEEEKKEEKPTHEENEWGITIEAAEEVSVEEVKADNQGATLEELKERLKKVQTK